MGIKQLDIIECGFEKMSAATRSTAFFWETEEADVFREAFMDFKDKAECLLMTLRKFEANNADEKILAEQSNAYEGFLDAETLF